MGLDGARAQKLSSRLLATMVSVMEPVSGYIVERHYNYQVYRLYRAYEPHVEDHRQHLADFESCTNQSCSEL